MYSPEENNIEAAKQFDSDDPLRKYRNEFSFPKTKDGKDFLYFAGHSLGLRPENAKKYIDETLEDWATFGVEGHFEGKYPWMPYHEYLTKPMAKVVGAKECEVVVMNTLTVNLHLMMVSFYRPTKTRFKILIENNTFPSDVYAVKSQARFHGYDFNEAVVELKPREGEMTVREEDILKQIEELGDSLALVMLGNCNYLSGQAFNIETVTKKAHETGALCGFNLAHGAGNLILNLHDHNVDFAVWCSYKYLNSGPGGIAAAFVHEKHHTDSNIPRFEGWWGQNKKTRFVMGPDFDPIQSVEAWQLSNPPIFQMASLRASLELFDEATMPSIRAKGDKLTSYLEFLFKENCGDFVEIITPSFSEENQVRGSMLSLRFKKNPKELVKSFGEKGIICDFREPDILRMAPAPLYNSYQDVFELVHLIKEIAHGK